MTNKIKIITDYSNFNDRELVEAITTKKGRSQLRLLQEVLYYRYVNKVYAKCYTLVRHTEDARDITHDIFVKIFIHLPKFRLEAQLSTWIYSITYNQCLTFLKTQNRIQFDNFDVEKIDSQYINNNANQKVLLEVKLSRLENLLEEINEEERILIMMRYWDGLSIKRIAKIINIGESATKMRLQRSREHLYKLYNIHS
ncbi:MAG: RNA polymerase sigma factor [Bacteroidota bacterium]|nr:RNA polymerase sigma factor [Bacteroidota bacterium]